MIKKTIKILGVALVLNSMTASAYQAEFLNYETSLINQDVTLANTFLDTNKFAIRKVSRITRTMILFFVKAAQNQKASTWLFCCSFAIYWDSRNRILFSRSRLNS